MKLIYRITLHLSIVLSILLTGWTIFFYINIINEVNDETDDSLEDYSEIVVTRILAGQSLPTNNDGSNNRYHISKISADYQQSHPAIEYIDEMIFIKEKDETEPARTLKTVFKDSSEEYFLLTVSTPTIDKEDLKESILFWIICLYIALLFTILLVNIWVYYRSMKPLYELLHWFDAYKIGTKNKPLKSDTQVVEFKKLNEAVRRNTERTEQAFERQKQFIGNASHEVQTPLAICQNRLEMLADSPSLTEEQLSEIIKTQQTIEYISRLNKSLLFLSKIDNQQFPENSKLSINAIFTKYLSDFKEIYAHRKITTSIVEDAELKVCMNEPLACTLISNLIKNAFVHNVDNGQINIEISQNSFSISNTGDEKPLDRSMIFERFYQGEKKKEGSTGLGLSIVDAICKTYHFSISYKYDNKVHCFKLIF